MHIKDLLAWANGRQWSDRVSDSLSARLLSSWSASPDGVSLSALPLLYIDPHGQFVQLKLKAPLAREMSRSFLAAHPSWAIARISGRAPSHPKRGKTGGGEGLEDHGRQAVGGEGQGKKAGEYRYLSKSVYEAAAQELFQEGVITSPNEVCLRIMTVVGCGDKCAYQHGHVNKANLTKLAQAMPRSFQKVFDMWGGLATWQVICHRQQTIMGSGAAGNKQQGGGRKCGANDERLDVGNAYSGHADDVSSDESDGVSGCEPMEDHSSKRGVGLGNTGRSACHVPWVEVLGGCYPLMPSQVVAPSQAAEERPASVHKDSPIIKVYQRCPRGNGGGLPAVSRERAAGVPIVVGLA